MYTSSFFRFFPFIPISLKTKFLASVLPPVTVSFLVISLIAGILTYQDIKQKILIHYEKNSQNYVKSLRLPLWNMNNKAIEYQIISISNNPDISGVKIVDAVFGITFKAGDIPGEKELSSYLVFSKEISYSPNTEMESLGTLFLYFKKKQIFHSVLKQFFQYSLLFFILVIVVIASALFSYHRTINIPLGRLIKSIRRFDKDKNVTPVVWTTDDEIGEVISSYNGLIVSLEMGNSQLKRALEEARKANQIKSEFLANMSHEIRTPLNGIQGLSELVLDTELHTEQKYYLETIYTESEQLLTIVNDILDFSKIEAGKMEFEQIPFDLDHTLENLCSPLKIQASKKGIELRHSINSNAVTELIGDPGRLRQILINLIGNSIKFTPKGKVLVNVLMTSESDQKAGFRFSVKDTGIGIPKDKQDKIFESFSQADGSTTRRFGGTGLGITISKMLLEQMGGNIALKSKPGRGSLFYFDIEFKKQTSALKRATLSNIDFSSLTAMVVGGLKANRCELKEHLETWGCKTLSADTAGQALEIIESYKNKHVHLDLIFIHYKMQDMTGFELAQTIREFEFCKETPLAILTSKGGVGDAKQCRQIKVDGYLIRPVSREDLKMFITFVIGQKNQIQDHDKILITRHTLAETKRKKIKVLLVEDYQTSQMLVTKQLENAGFYVTLASDGQKAVDLFSKNSFDIVLMDIQMPKMDGYEACRLIRNMEKDKKRTPIIAMTAHAMKGYKQQCLDSGMDDYLTKPLKKDILLSTVSKHIQNKLYFNHFSSADELNGESSTKENMNQPIDFKKALKEFENDKGFLFEVLDSFIDIVEKQISIIDSAIDTNDFDTIKNECHAIKGGAANLTAIPLSIAAHELEILGQEHQRDIKKNTFNKMIHKWNDLKDFKYTLKKRPE